MTKKEWVTSGVAFVGFWLVLPWVIFVIRTYFSWVVDFSGVSL